jgi:hypothetical protein
MLLPLGTAAIVLMALLSVLALPRLQQSFLPTLRALITRLRHNPRYVPVDNYDPGRELRAEQRARALLRSCVNEEEWSMYSELGFLRIWGTLAERPLVARTGGALLHFVGMRSSRARGGTETPYAYLVYPHKPILAYIPQSGVVLGEYCVEFPDTTYPYGSARLPDADDVLAKWVALTTEERSLIEQSNMHLPGRQIGIAQARRDLARLSCWERERLGSRRRASLRAGSVPAL